MEYALKKYFDLTSTGTASTTVAHSEVLFPVQRNIEPPAKYRKAFGDEQVGLIAVMHKIAGLLSCNTHPPAGTEVILFRFGKYPVDFTSDPDEVKDAFTYITQPNELGTIVLDFDPPVPILYEKMDMASYMFSGGDAHRFRGFVYYTMRWVPMSSLLYLLQEK